ncbi:MAG: phospholipid carrier-dependent glycosyltransferase [Demequinaceae bacterium]|nr:phospholipid carrier-dependent glycosyltransferase [Demequinaceae bacterium]
MIVTLWRWRVTVMAAAVTALAALLRFADLGHPRALVFDEVYYARGAYSLLQMGYEGDWGDDKGHFAQGDFSDLATKGDYVVHPMVGKLLIAAGMRVAGNGPFGYRFAGAFLGTATVLIVALLVRRILKSTLWGGIAGLLLAVDGEHIVLSRTAILDIFLAFFVVAGFALLWLDRWRAQRIYAEHPAETTGPFGPRVGPRWWRLAAIVTFGLASGVKWSGATFAAAFLVLFVILDAVDRRAAGYKHWLPGAALRSALPGAFAAVILMPATYVAQWANWFLTKGSYDRDWAQTHPGQGVTWLPEALRSLWHYHVSMFNYHKTLDSPHPWESHPAGWIIQFRPTAFFFEKTDLSTCRGDNCVEAITSVGNPFIWWAGLAALCFAIWRLFLKRDSIGMIFGTGVLVGYLPWEPYAHRTIFTFYSVAMAPFVVMTLAWALERFARPDDLEGRYSRVRALTVGWFLVAVLVLSAFFYPVWTGQPIPSWYRQIHVWLPTW